MVDPFGDLAELLTRLQAAYSYIGYNTQDIQLRHDHVIGLQIDPQLGTLSFYFNGVK